MRQKIPECFMVVHNLQSSFGFVLVLYPLITMTAVPELGNAAKVT